ncbi:MAG: glycine cleavage system protein GcvH [Verrucomicrobia bacterium]|nr:glycine cleavage system protein GcvH [Verrucomicrobiota bacterium]
MKFTDSHEWVKDDGTVGITDHAQKELGDIVYVQLPPIGTHVVAGREAAVLESTKAAADIYAPVSGRVVAVNDALKDNPSLLNADPENAGWLFQVEIETPEQLQKLLTKEQYSGLLQR